MKDQYVQKSRGGDKFGMFEEQIGKWSWSAVSWVRWKRYRRGSETPTRGRKQPKPGPADH